MTNSHLQELDENAVVASFRKGGESRSSMIDPGAAQLAAGAEQAGATLFSFANSLNAMTETAAKAERAINDGVAGTVLTGEEDNGYRGTSGADTSENLLCPKTPYNITGIFQPTLLFVAEMEVLAPTPRAPIAPSFLSEPPPSSLCPALCLRGV